MDCYRSKLYNLTKQDNYYSNLIILVYKDIVILMISSINNNLPCSKLLQCDTQWKLQ